MERAVEDEYRPGMLQELRRQVEELARTMRTQPPVCSPCKRVMVCQDVRRFRGWRGSDGCGLACRVIGALSAKPKVGRCWICWVWNRGAAAGLSPGTWRCWPRAVPYTLAARLADFLLGVKISPMGIWKVTQRRGQAVANYVILLEDGKPRPFTVFDTPTSQGRMPVELALLFDTTPKVEPLWYPGDIFRFITQWDDGQSRETLHPTKDQAEVRISVYQTFGQKLYRMAQPTTDPHAVTTALGQTRGTFAV